MTQTISMKPPSEFTITDAMRAAARSTAQSYDRFAKAKPGRNKTAEETLAAAMLDLLEATVSENIDPSGRLPTMSNLEKMRIYDFMSALVRTESENLSLIRPRNGRYYEIGQRSR